MALEGIKHLIECHCVLPQYRTRNPPLYHKFVVFSIIDDDKVVSKIAQCNNCGIIHKVIDLCKSEIAHGMEEGNSIRSIDDIKPSLPDKLVEFMSKQSVDLATWENVEFVIENKQEIELILNKDQKDDVTQLKILHIREDGTFKIKSEIRQDEMVIS